MKRKDGFILRQIAGQYMAVPTGSRTREIHGMITLNETGAFLWEMLGSDQTAESLVEALLAEYETDEQVAFDAVREFVDKLRREEVMENE